MNMQADAPCTRTHIHPSNYQKKSPDSSAISWRLCIDYQQLVATKSSK